MLTVQTLALKTRAAVIALAALIAPCGGCGDWFALDFNKKSDLKLANFDVFSSDMKASVRAFKPRDIETNEKLGSVKGDRRLAFTSKKNGTDNFYALAGVYGSGTFSLGVNYAFDSSIGLRPDLSYAYAQAFGEVSGDFFSKEIRATYHDDLDDGDGGFVPGIRVHALDTQPGALEPTSLGTIDFPGAQSADLRMIQFDDRLEWRARPAEVAPSDGYGGDDEVDFTTFAMNMDTPVEFFELGLGAGNLDKKGEVYADMIWFLGPDHADALPFGDRFYFDNFSTVNLCLREAKDALGSDPDLGDISLAIGSIESALSTAISNFNNINSAFKGNNILYPLSEDAAGKQATKAGKMLYKKLDKAVATLDKMLESGKINKGKLKGVCKTLNTLIGRATVGQANMFGVTASKFGQIDRGVHIPARKIPAIFDD